MNTQRESEQTLDTSAPKTDQTRRKLASAGVAGAGILLSVASRSAMGGWGQCTGSELASGNLSRTGDPNPCGCSPGYWWNQNGSESWDRYLASTYPKTANFNTVFGVNFFAKQVTLAQCGPGRKNDLASWTCEGNMNNVAMHAVAALLNAAFFGTRYPVPGLQNPAAVVAAFQAAFNAGNGKCAALKSFVDRVDVYSSKSTWCFGKDH